MNNNSNSSSNNSNNNKKNDYFVPTAVRVSKVESSVELLTKGVYICFIIFF